VNIYGEISMLQQLYGNVNKGAPIII